MPPSPSTLTPVRDEAPLIQIIFKILKLASLQQISGLLYKRSYIHSF